MYVKIVADCVHGLSRGAARPVTASGEGSLTFVFSRSVGGRCERGSSEGGRVCFISTGSQITPDYSGVIHSDHKKICAEDTILIFSDVAVTTAVRLSVDVSRNYPPSRKYSARFIGEGCLTCVLPSPVP